VLSQELPAGAQGTSLVAATPRAKDESWRDRLLNSTMVAPRLCLPGGEPCEDFLSGGTTFQAVTDIAGGNVGGGAELCDLANSEDESAVQFYSEALAFSFFTSAGMLPVPWTLLGARRYLSKFSGESSTGPPYFSSCGRLRKRDWLNENIMTRGVEVQIGGMTTSLAPIAFVAVASVCSGCTSTCEHGDLVNNNCDGQRRHLDEDLSLWYQAFEPSMYASLLQPALRKLVRRVGTGPWGAGVWWGDSQQYFLAVWLATTLLAGRSLDYYVYDHFCENPGNQCFVLGAEGCAACVAQAAQPGLLQASRCGSQSLKDMVSTFAGRTAAELHTALSQVGSPPSQVFDLLAQSAVSSQVVLK